MEECNPLEKNRRFKNVLVKNNQVFPMKKKIILPKLKISQTAPARITGHLTKQKPNHDFPELYNEKFTYKKHSKLPTPLSQRQEVKNHCPTPSCLSPSYSDYFTSDHDSQLSETTELPEFDSGFLETLNKEVCKRVISGLVLTTKCGKKAQEISEKHLGKKISWPVCARFCEFSTTKTTYSPHANSVVTATWEYLVSEAAKSSKGFQ